MPDPVKIPANIDALRKGIASKLANPNLGKPEDKGNDAAERDRKRRIADLRKAKDQAEQSKEQLAQQLAEIQAELDEAKKAREEAQTKIAELEPAAKNWQDYSHKEKQLLIAKLPPELKKEAADMDIRHLKLLVKGGTETRSGGEQIDRSKMTDDDMAKLAVENPAKFMELLEAPKK